MEEEEELILTTLGWKGKGLIKSAYDSITNGNHQTHDLDGEYCLTGISLQLFSFHASFLFKSLKSMLLYEGFVVWVFTDGERSVVEEDGRPCRQKISYIFCDMDGKMRDHSFFFSFIIFQYYSTFIFANKGTLLNSKSQITMRTREALNEAISRGVRIVIATGKVINRLVFVLSIFVKQHFISTTPYVLATKG